jgi:hypothetical protein
MLKTITKFAARTFPTWIIYLAIATVLHTLYTFFLSHLPEVTKLMKDDIAFTWVNQDKLRQEVLAAA